MKDSLRARAARLVEMVISGRASLADELPKAREGLSGRDGALLQALVLGTLREGPRLQWLLEQLLSRPMRKRDRIVYAALMLGLHQIASTRVPSHAAVSETVDAVRALGQPRAAGLVNAILRRFIREKDALWESPKQSDSARLQHPDWLIQAFRADWPEQAEQICQAGNAAPPMVLRANRQRLSRDQLIERLAAEGISARPGEHADTAVWLDRPVPVSELPGFSDGDFSVQDESAQLVAPLMDLAAGQRVLDACAAPGGKSAHLLESCPDMAELLCLDVEASRLARVEENLQRLGPILAAKARCQTGDGTRPAHWWDGRPFDRILLDVPCSGTGVIRRHPDIKYLRRASDIKGLAAVQRDLLDKGWEMLAPGGRLVYTTCSLLVAENAKLLADFLRSQPDALPREAAVPAALSSGAGCQRLPATASGDGFFYAVIEKPAA